MLIKGKDYIEKFKEVLKKENLKYTNQESQKKMLKLMLS